LLNGGAPGRTPHCLLVRDGPTKLEEAVIWMPSESGVNAVNRALRKEELQFENCVILAASRFDARVTLRDCVFLKQVELIWDSQLVLCTISRALLGGVPTTLTDCIIGDVEVPSRAPGNRMDHCVTFGKASSDVQRGNGCSVADPMFRDQKNLDFRLNPGSPCIGKASDGGDIGCRYTPEMIELCKIALELRSRGVIKF